ncbi:hypothetical protein LY632_04685 [Erythrobacter sp. SDW2]|uniref:hypothetical protein n=1 Tax=Erythrobacter sp. SDW2 TaxID=2907154 RepID=UPI001F36BCEE|nr:hypothetical protein [Erythrobacter sp. SDW2]UIP07700.1 hypothetical protein LY632_04685 [Erythrobacter sp. SDW2]
MKDLSAIVADPNWLPHEIDAAGRKVRFLKLHPDVFRSRGFLAEVRSAQTEAWVGFDQLLAMQPLAGPVHFIFHSGFCRSTLLLQAVGAATRASCLNEPGILNGLARMETIEQSLVDAIVALLARPHNAGEAAVMIKPSNFPNRLIPQLMRSRADAKAIIITNDLRSFLEAVVRKGLLGRQWGRQVCLTTHGYATGSGGFDLATMAGLTDLQLSGLGWLYLQSWFTDRLAAPGGERMAVVDSAFFNDNRGEVIAEAAAHLGLPLDRSDLGAVLEGPVFRSHSKLGGDFAAKEQRDRERSHSEVNDEEIASVLQWIGEIARVSDLTAPVARTILPNAPRR